jgi:type II secretory pathway pseudopilin PulG
VLVALVVVALLASGLAMPLSAQMQQRRVEEARRQLDEAKEALLGFAAAHGRLPCPASAASRGEESFAAGGDATSGACAAFHDGFLPAATLGLSPLDSEGFLRDPWGSPRNRIRYAVFGAGLAVNGVANPLTRANGMQAATLPGLGAASHYLFICGSSAGVTASGCGAASNQLTRPRGLRPPLARPERGPTTPRPASDEARNLDGDAVFVSRDAAAPGTPGASTTSSPGCPCTSSRAACSRRDDSREGLQYRHEPKRYAPSDPRRAGLARHAAARDRPRRHQVDPPPRAHQGARGRHPAHRRALQHVRGPAAPFQGHAHVALRRDPERPRARDLARTAFAPWCARW